MDMVRKKVLMACSNYWNSPFQVGSHHIARGFIKMGWEVAFLSDPISPLHFITGNNKELVERFTIYSNGGYRDYDDHLWAYVPGAFLTPHNKPVLKTEWLYRHWDNLTFPNIVSKLRKNGFGEIDLVYFDSAIHLSWLNKVKYKKAVYRVADNNRGFAKYTPAYQKVEQSLANTVDTVIYTAKNLEKFVQAMKPRNMLHVPNGVNFEHFNSGSIDLPAEYISIPKPIVIYVGAIDIWFDFDLVNFLAEKLPNISFVLIGPDKLAKIYLKKLPNIHLLGRKDYSVLPQYLYNADVGIIPFNIKKYPDLVNSINPLKLYEYMACGLPVVTADWEELKYLESPAKLCNTKEQFAENIIESVTNKYDKNILINYAQNQDWSQKIKEICECLMI